MKHYELAYETREGKCLIIPHLLKEDRPSELPDFQVGESLMLRYKSDKPLPPDTISRFIVRHNQEIKNENSDYKVWRYGVILEDGKGSTAMVREDDRTISVSVKGRDKTNYISALRETLNDIFNSYQSEKPELQYKVERFGKLPVEYEEKNPLWLQEKEIYKHFKRKRPYYDVFTDQDIPMANIVNVFNISGGNIPIIINPIINFSDCIINLQDNLNNLSEILLGSGNTEEAKKIKNASEDIAKIEKSNNGEEKKKKSVLNRLKDVVVDLGDENSKLYKIVKGIGNSISIAREIVKAYLKITQGAS